MTRPQIPCAPAEESPNLVGEPVPALPEPPSPHTQNHATPNQVLLLVLPGYLSAAVIATLFCQLPHSRTLTWTTLFVQSVWYLVLVAAAGLVGTSIPWLFLKVKPGLGRLVTPILITGIFFPCILLLYHRRSPWLYLAIALTTIVSALNLRRLFPAPAETNQLPHHHTGVLPSLYGLPIAAFRPLRAALIAICAQAALICAATGRLFLAGALTSIALSLLLWRWSAFNPDSSTTFAGKRRSLLLSAAAFLFTVFALIPWIAVQPFGWVTRNVAFHRPPQTTPRTSTPNEPNFGYVGIVLWPPPKKKTEIVPPTPHVHNVSIGRARPIVIPFDGPYWYFKAPSTKPSPRAHIAHGQSTAVTIRSSDWEPLLMAAHQNLGSSIDLECCSEIDVTITNADTRPGTIALGLRLTDSGSIRRPSQDLGERTIVSSKAAQIPLNRPPVDEVLRFPIARPATIHRFDEITIDFLSARERARGAAKVAIQSFTLIPR